MSDEVTQAREHTHAILTREHSHVGWPEPHTHQWVPMEQVAEWTGAAHPEPVGLREAKDETARVIGEVATFANGGNEPAVSWTDDPMREARRIAARFPDGLIAWLLAHPEPVGLREAAQRLCDAIADEAAVKGLAQAGMSQGWKAEMDAEDAVLCALQDTRTLLDGRERPHVHRAALSTEGVTR